MHIGYRLDTWRVDDRCSSWESIGKHCCRHFAFDNWIKQSIVGGIRIERRFIEIASVDERTIGLLSHWAVHIMHHGIPLFVILFNVLGRASA